MPQTGDVVLVTGSSKAIAWLEEVALPKDREPFIKHWTIDIADDHYELDITAARVRLGWKPQHRLHASLRDIVRGLRADPAPFLPNEQTQGARGFAAAGVAARAPAAGLTDIARRKRTRAPEHAPARKEPIGTCKTTRATSTR